MKLRYRITHRKLRPPLLFLHLPKAAGTSIFTLLQDVLRPRDVAYYFDRTQFGDFDDFDSLSQDMRAGLLLAPREIELDLAAGHVSRTTLLSLAGGRGRLMTVVREPMSRLLSHWMYWRGYDDARLALYGGWGRRIALSRGRLADFGERPEIASATDNPLLRMLLWPHPLIPDGGFIDPSHDETLLSEAIKHLSHFDFVGSVENPHLMSALSAWLNSAYPPSAHIRLMRGLSALLHGQKEAATERNEQRLTSGIGGRWLSEEVASAERVLRERTRLDLKLWECAQNTYAAAASPISSSVAFSNTVARYTTMAGEGAK